MSRIDLPTSVVREATRMLAEAGDPYAVASYVTHAQRDGSAQRTPTVETEETEEDFELDGWEPADLAAALTAEPLEPTILTRTDGVSLLYPGKIHTIYGETESLKTWAAYVAGRQVLDAGGKLLVIDYEDVETTFAQRLTALGVAEDVLVDLDRVRFHAADRSAGTLVVARWRKWEPTLVIVDGVTAALDVEGADPNSGTDIASWYRRVLRPVSDAGACVVSLDHVAKSSDAKKNPIASVHKKNGITGAAYRAESSQQLAKAFGDPVDGSTRLYVEKDRPGGVRGRARADKAAADIRLTAYPDGGVSFEVALPGSRKSVDLEKKILDRLATYPGTSKSELRSLGNSTAVDEALDILITDRRIRVEKVGLAHQHYLAEAPDVAA